MSENTFIRTGVPGIFYRRPAPSEPVFVEEGAEVAVGTTVGLVEIMKNFHEVLAEAPGTVVRFLVQDNDEVDPGQELVEIAPVRR